eukprot:6196318-Pleurochrysis_carterae.AAC.1
MRVEFARHLASLLQAECGIDLVLYLKTDLTLSDRCYAKARLALCKSYCEKGAGHAVCDTLSRSQESLWLCLSHLCLAPSGSIIGAMIWWPSLA